MARPSYQTVTIQVDVVVSIQNGEVKEYWKSVTPHKPLLKNPKNNPAPATNANEAAIKAAGTVIRWELRVSDLATGLSVNPSKFHKSGGIVINKDADVGTIWDDTWGVPTRKTEKKYELLVPATADPGVVPFKYSAVFEILGNILTIDPEVEFDSGE